MSGVRLQGLLIPLSVKSKGMDLTQFCNRDPGKSFWLFVKDCLFRRLVVVLTLVIDFFFPPVSKLPHGNHLTHNSFLS